MNNNPSNTVSLYFTKEQAKKADVVLKEMTEQNRVKNIDKSADGKMLLYRIQFNLLFDCYLFGTKTAHIFRPDRCLSDKDGVCKLPVNTCNQCTQ